MTSQSHRFGMFAKFWEPGRVKTRLAANIGELAAAQVYQSFLNTSLARFSQCSNPLLAYSPREHVAKFQELINNADCGWELQSQGTGDLGQRMHRFFEQAFSQGFPCATLIGSDTPTLPISFIAQTEILLKLHDVVLGPSEDGGYYLVAARQSVPPIFSNISWSSPDVWQQTIDRLQQHRLSFAVLPSWYDVDELGDLQRLRAELDSAHTEQQLQDTSLIHLRQQLQSILESP